MAAWERIAARVALAGMAANAALAAVKIAVGLAATSVAVVSDGMESGADVITSSLVWLGLWIASKPADSDHPYGHGRFEILTGLAMGTLLAAAGATICVRSIEHRYDEHVPELFAVWALVVSIAVHGTLAAIKLRIGKKSGSAALTADAWHDMTDLISGCVALAALLLAVFVPGMRAADHYGGFIIGLIVIFLGARVARETTMQLMDTMPEGKQVEQIRASAMRVPGAMAVEKCFARKTGLRYHVDLHLEVDPYLTVLESHQIAHAVQLQVKSDLEWVADVLVHVEPHFITRPADWPAAKIVN